jgi:hypothetical protein
MEFEVPTLSKPAEGHTGGSVIRELPSGPARSKNLCMHEVFMRENREIPRPPAGLIAGGPLGQG